MSRASRRSRPARGRSSAAVKSAGSNADNAGGDLLGGIELAELKRLIRLVQRTGIGELELSSGGRSVRISATAGATVPVLHAPAPSPAAQVPEASSGGAGANAPAAPAKNERHVAITSPMVGTFYRAPAPDADPYIEVGDMVEAGSTVCIIEAMKLMNTIEAESRGRVVEILIENAQPVEFGQKLFLIDPA